MVEVISDCNIGDFVYAEGSSANYSDRRKIVACGFVSKVRPLELAFYKKEGHFIARTATFYEITTLIRLYHTNIDFNIVAKEGKNYKIFTNNLPREEEMNEIIINAYPKTKDAVIVNKWFGSKLNDPLFALLLKGKEEDLLAEAIRLEEESKKK